MTKAELVKALERYDDDTLVLLAAGDGFVVADGVNAVRVKPAEGGSAAACDWMNGGSAGRAAACVRAR